MAQDFGVQAGIGDEIYVRLTWDGAGFDHGV